MSWSRLVAALLVGGFLLKIFDTGVWLGPPEQLVPETEIFFWISTGLLFSTSIMVSRLNPYPIVKEPENLESKNEEGYILMKEERGSIQF